ncbi:PqqD family peptide modification chaperone [Lentzea sp. BCCO 10_0798]|uniref:PqqD family peptide modification chaperone n=1 Tax=Lentzea kristufekii TaxID=3095430 RepID=A0ABU4TYT6_9PSEU|nr:PqqD family peptide modification chaperone [Lentzea sp. BCCO 10_0798]MDX8053482.1 PqqD family peptide modification chaperone [Lentzea sp. BCCO 10_0798]
MRVLVEPGVSSTFLGGGGIAVLSERTGKLHVGNSTASAMWSAIVDHDGDVDRAAAAVATFFGVDNRKVKVDLEQLVGALKQAGLVRTEP